jgi:hypothetical protein
MNGLLVSSEPVVAACTELSPLAAALPTQLMRTSLEIDHLGLSTTLVADREAAFPSANHSTLPTSVTFRQTEGAVLPHSLDVSFGMRHRKRGERSRLFLLVTLVDDRIVREPSRLLALLLGDLLGLLDELVLFAQPTLSLSIFCLGHASPIPGDLALKPL